MFKQKVKEAAILALFFTVIITPIAWIFDFYYGHILINALAMFLFLFLVYVLFSPITEAESIGIIPADNPYIHIAFTAFERDFFKFKIILNLFCFALMIMILVSASKIGMLISKSKHQVSPIDLIWCSPIPFIYAYIVKSFKYFIFIQNDHIYFQNRKLKWRIAFETIQSYYVQPSAKKKGYIEWRISLKSGEHYYYIIHPDLHQHLRSWFMARGMRAKQLKQ